MIKKFLPEPGGRSQGLDPGGHLLDDPGELVALRGRNPGKDGPVLLDAQIVEEVFQKGELPPGREVAADVVALARMAARNQNSVGPVLQGPDDIERIDPAGTGQPDETNVGWILESADPGQVGPGVGTPVADHGNDLRFPLWIVGSSHFISGLNRLSW